MRDTAYPEDRNCLGFMLLPLVECKSPLMTGRIHETRMPMTSLEALVDDFSKTLTMPILPLLEGKACKGWTAQAAATGRTMGPAIQQANHPIF